MSSNPTETSNQAFDTPSKLRPPRTFAAPGSQPNTNQNTNNEGSSSISQVSPGGRTLRKRRLDSSDELSVKPSQTSKKVILQSNPSANTIKSNTSLRTTSSLAGSKISKTSTLSSSNANNNTKKLNYSSRPGWDTKGRLEDMEKTLHDKLAQSEEANSRLLDAVARIQELEKNRDGLQNTVVVKETQYSHLTEELDKIKRELARTKEDAESELTYTKKKLLTQIEDLERQKDTAKREFQKLEVELRCAIEENNGLKISNSRQSAAITGLEARISSFKNSVEALETTLKQKDETLLKSQMSEQVLVHRLRELEEKLHSAECVRRKLHNDVLELKGNIRVFCRVRPLLPSDNTSKLDHLQFGEKSDGAETESLTLFQASESATGQPITKMIPFSFDRVFSPEATQAAVFDEISQLVQSSLDGYRVCIFAYGQTGSGKTFTMEGSRDAPGMIPLAVQQIFETAHHLSTERQWIFSFEASYLEIYNETLRDLIEDNSKPLEVKHQVNKTIVSGLTYVQVESPEQVHNLLSKAANNRAVAETQCNERSSRSHSVFILNISGNNASTGESIEGILNLVDLAGSERLNQSGSTGDRLKETQAINKSLSALGDVIAALASKEAHIPFRNSKLTYLLQNSLGGNCKTLMFVNINPAEASFGESLCSLRFATKVNSCHIGTARKMVKKD